MGLSCETLGAKHSTKLAEFLTQPDPLNLDKCRDVSCVSFPPSCKGYFRCIGSLEGHGLGTAPFHNISFLCKPSVWWALVGVWCTVPVSSCKRDGEENGTSLMRQWLRTRWFLPQKVSATERMGVDDLHTDHVHDFRDFEQVLVSIGNPWPSSRGDQRGFCTTFQGCWAGDGCLPPLEVDSSPFHAERVGVNPSTLDRTVRATVDHTEGAPK